VTARREPEGGGHRFLGRSRRGWRRAGLAL